jgi:flagellar FliJ protein
VKAFKFKLERILSLRKYREREWEIKLAAVTGECVQLRREIEEREEGSVRELKQRSGLLETRALLASHLYMARLQQESAKKRSKLSEKERQREEVQREYLDASKDRKVLDKLKEKRSSSYVKEQKVEEVKQVDDINTGRAARRR